MAKSRKKLTPNQELYRRSGEVKSTDPLVGLLYVLMRDHVAPGTVEKIIQDCGPEETMYTNGWLATYAQDLAKRLR